MSFCPKCKAEYDPGFTVCAECGVALVEELEEKAGRVVSPQEREMFLWAANNHIEASIVEAILEEEQIPYRASNAAYTAVSGIIGVSPDLSCDYFVMEGDYEQARAVLEADMADFDPENVTFEFPEEFDEEEEES